jgi:hypothetical protein
MGTVKISRDEPFRRELQYQIYVTVDNARSLTTQSFSPPLN